MLNVASFWKPEACGQTVLPDRSVLIRQKFVENAKIKKFKFDILRNSWCLKITEKVSFNIASEASYVYILSGQKLIKKCKKLSIFASFWKPEACGQTVLPDKSVLIGQKFVENAKIKKFKCDILSNFQTMLKCLNFR